MMCLMSPATTPARLALEDGTIFHGSAFGACDEPINSTGEVVFNTAMCGYQEALTDPSYAGQILTMTAPQIGNYGVNDLDVESGAVQVKGFVIRELARRHSNFRATTDLDTWLKTCGVLAIQGFDTRALVRKLRIDGSMRGVLSCDQARTDDELVQLARSAPLMAGCNLAGDVSPAEPGSWDSGLGDWNPDRQRRTHSERKLRVVTLDCGAKQNIYRNLVERNCEVIVLPYDSGAEAIRQCTPDGLFISNGPGDPEAVDKTISTLREVAGEVPTFGICLGHQLLALALGAKAYKLKFGHRGANQPVRNNLTGRIEITSQNHGFCVDERSLASIDCEITHLHLNDRTVAGFRHCTKPIFSVQFHPEASPGPHDSSYLFDMFIEMMKSGQPIDAGRMKQVQDLATT